ncbi:MAG: M48 family metallopeptidase [Abitibacteriaceae bacterium]|nr:M48 family metallopeptidase [Abditibacteriaceae bacterium]
MHETKAPQSQAVGKRSLSGPIIVPAPSAKAVQYYRSGNALWVVNEVWGFLVPAAFLFTGFSARLRSWAQRLGRKWIFTVGLYFASFSGITFIVDLPLSYYQTFLRQHAYGLSNQTLAKWVGDSLKDLGVGVVSGCLVAWAVYWLVRQSPRRWWLYAAALSIPFTCFSMLVVPLWIDPLYNKFGPMQDKVLEAKILSLAHRAGIENSRVYEVNKSEDTKAINAYVTGFGSSKRIVLWDTSIKKLNERELLFVMGHEMGHYVLGHIVWGIFLSSFAVLFALFAVDRLSNRLIGRYSTRFGFNQLSDIASLPLVFLVVHGLYLVVNPVVFAYTRHIEHEADRFGLEITRDNHDAATAFVKMQTENLSIPRPGWLFKVWRSTHPPLGERIDFCNTYRPWATGQPLRYGHLFKNP